MSEVVPQAVLECPGAAAARLGLLAQDAVEAAADRIDEYDDYDDE